MMISSCSRPPFRFEVNAMDEMQQQLDDAWFAERLRQHLPDNLLPLRERIVEMLRRRIKW
jgi:hypothetical protein